MSRLFGTDGIRGTINQWPLTVDFVLKLGQAVALVIGDGYGRPVVVLGRDPRQSGHMLESALAAGLMSQGVDVRLAGVITTPGVAYLTRAHQSQLGIVISASHNPFDHNGIKIFGADGFKIPDETEMEIERLLLDTTADYGRVDAERLGRSWDASDWRQDYVDHLVNVWGESRWLQGKRIVLDCANGATSNIAPEVFHRLGGDIILMESEPNGFNINEHYEYIWPESLRAVVLQEKALIGIAFDGDGDRVMLVDEKGGYVNGDVIMAILARFMKQRGLLTNNAVVSTPMSNWGLKASLEEAGIRLEETSVGDRFVLQRMIGENYALGGEQSGHIIILRHGQTTGDGIYTALAVLKAIESAPDQSLSTLAACIQELPECLISIDVSRKPPLHTIPEIQTALQRLQTSLGENVDITLRYSGTENKLRLKIRAGEEHEQRRLEQEAEAFMSVAKQAIG
jgi:phosphoglucosamine mutase